ncbi:MAG: hypothetical protein WCB93_02275, partial [Gallionella sp.]
VRNLNGTEQQRAGEQRGMAKEMLGNIHSGSVPDGMPHAREEFFPAKNFQGARSWLIRGRFYQIYVTFSRLMPLSGCA